jgi:transcriptional regulator with XRE-family HTH domain
MTTLAKKLGKRISQIRRQRGMTSERLAYENDLSKGYLSDIENGKRLPSLKTLERLARALHVKLKDLFDF